MECYQPTADPERPSESAFAQDDTTTTLDQAYAETVSAGYVDVTYPDPLGHAWQPADPAEVVSRGDPGRLELTPLTYSSVPVAAGAVELPAVTDPRIQGLSADTELFAPGDLIVVGPGQSNAEIVRVASPDPLVLSTPLRGGHLEGTPLLLWEPSEAGRVERLAGSGRIETSVAASQDGFPVDGSAGTVVLARADDFPDALTGTPLAVALGGPLLLTDTSSLSAATLAEIRRVLPAGATVHLLGGEVALSAQVAADVEAAGYAVTRHAGPSRFETAVVVADALAALGEADAVVLATGTTAPDALAAGVVAARRHGVVLLTGGDQPVPPTDEWLARFHDRPVTALGGPAAAAYPDATPLVGATRFETATAAAAAVPPVPGALAVVASGERFPDALSGGWLVARAQGVITYAGQSVLPEVTAGHLAATQPGRVALLGGTAALDGGVATQVATALTP